MNSGKERVTFSFSMMVRFMSTIHQKATRLSSNHVAKVIDSFHAEEDSSTDIRTSASGGSTLRGVFHVDSQNSLILGDKDDVNDRNSKLEMDNYGSRWYILNKPK